MWDAYYRTKNTVWQGLLFSLNNSATFLDIIASEARQSHKKKCIFP